MCPARSGPFSILTDDDLEPEEEAFLDEEMVMALEITMFTRGMSAEEIIRQAMLWKYGNQHNPP